MEFVFNASAQICPEHTLSSFTNLLLEQLNLEGQGEMFFDKKNFKIITIFFIRNPVCTLSARILLEARTDSFMSDTTKQKPLSQTECLGECKKLRFTLQMNDPVLHSFNEDLGHISESFNENGFEVNLREKRPHEPKFTHDSVRIHRSD